MGWMNQSYRSAGMARESLKNREGVLSENK